MEKINSKSIQVLEIIDVIEAYLSVEMQELHKKSKNFNIDLFMKQILIDIEKGVEIKPKDILFRIRTIINIMNRDI